jgi:glycosyltransferase involved in cell wall biosynthesis
MTDFHAMDSAAHEAALPEDKIRIYRELVSKAQSDGNFRETINYEKFWNSNKVFLQLLKKEPKRSGLNIAIVGYTSNLLGTWDPFDTIKGLPGSEECAVYASQELADQGHNVTLYMNPHKDSIWRSPFSNPRWLPENTWHIQGNTDIYDLVLMWRRFDVDTGRKRGKIVFFWPHDSPFQSVNYPNFPKFDGICVLSEHHRRQLSVYPEFDKIPYVICGNGLVTDQFTTPMQSAKDANPYSLGYFSNYSRGLGIVINIWPDIRREFPTASLSICYGRENWNTISAENLKIITDKIEEYQAIGVVECGKVGHVELASIMQNTSVWCYPCNTDSETFCITAVKAQAAGVIPVTTRIGALNETVHPHAPQIPLIRNEKDVQNYKDLLLSTLRRIRDSDPEEITQERLKYIEFGHKFSWSSCVNKWLQLYETVKK